MSSEKKSKRIEPGRPFEFYHYSDISEAESRSADIGFPPFCAYWAADGTLFVGGGGGSKGMGVRSSVVACRIVDRSAIQRDDLLGALVDPEDLAVPSRPLPKEPQVQAVGEVDTDDMIVSSFHSSGVQIIPAAPFYVPFTPSSHRGNRRASTRNTGDGDGDGDSTSNETSSLSPTSASKRAQPILPGSSFCAAAGRDIVVFDVRGNGTLSASGLPPFLSPSLASKSNSTSYNPFDYATPSIGRPSRRRFTSRLRFCADFNESKKNSFLSTCAFSPDGRAVAAGGSDAIVRLFLLDDPYIGQSSNTSSKPQVNSYFSATGLRTPLPSTRSKSQFFPGDTADGSSMSSGLATNSLGPPPVVSPLFLPVARHSSCASKLCFSPDGRFMITLSDATKDGAQAWRMPSVEQLRAYGARIPLPQTVPITPVENEQRSRHDPTERVLNDDIIQQTSFFNADKVKPVNKIEWPNGMECRGIEFWSYPKYTTVPGVNGEMVSIAIDPKTGLEIDPITAETLPDIMLAICHVKRTGPSYLCEFHLPKGFYSGVEQPILVTKTLIDKKCEASQLKISPNGHFVAVGTQHLHIFTGPASRTLRNRDLISQGFSLRDEKIKPIAALPPLSLICERRDLFDLPCTGISFDPSSRLCVAVSASRGVAFLAVEKHEKKSCLSSVLRIVFCVPVWRAVVHSQFLKFLFNVLLIAFIGLIVQHYSMAVTSQYGNF